MTDTNATGIATAEPEKPKEEADSTGRSENSEINPSTLVNETELKSTDPENAKTNAAAVDSIPANEPAKPADYKIEYDEAPAATASPPTGFAPFRYWINNQIQKRAAPTVLKYQEKEWTITEITNDGQIRLAHQGTFNLLPFDGRYIPLVLGQLI